MHRLFAAFPVPAEFAARLEALRADIPGAKWRRREHYHITLHFYGQVSPDIAEEIDRRLADITGPVLELKAGGVGWFGRKAPRALYARIAPDPLLGRLAKEARAIARSLSLKLDAHPFIPHITLAYCIDTPLSAAMNWSEDFQNFVSAPFYVDTFHLYESFTAPTRQSIYQAQADYRLGV